MHRVRRDELYGSSSEEEGHSQADAEEDAEVRAKLNERLSSLLGLDLSVPVPASGQASEALPQDIGGAGAAAAADQEDKPEEEEEEEFEFRLFSTSSKTAAPVKVILTASDDEDADLGDGAFTVPERPSSYYFAGEPTPDQLQMYRQSALAGEEILLGARKRAWGLERPWRIIRIGGGPAKSVRAPPHSAKGSSGAIAKVTAIAPNEDGEKLKRKRPGKKRRIGSRIKTKAEKEKREAAEKQKMTKEEHLKEKKKRLNREKKLKRRAKEREMKVTGKGQDGSQPTASNPADSGSDDDSAA